MIVRAHRMNRRSLSIYPSSGELTMPIIVACPCGKKLRISEKYAGRKARCPQCGNVFQIPAAEPLPEETYAEPAMETGPAQTAHAGGKARWIAVAIVVLVAGIAVYRYSTAGSASRPGAPQPPLAAAHLAEDEPDAPPEDPAAEPIAPAPAPEAAGQAADPPASAGGSDSPAAPQAPRRNASRLLQGFVAMVRAEREPSVGVGHRGFG